MQAIAELEIDSVDGRTVLPVVRSEPPLTLRRCGERVLLVGSAAGPVGGDELSLSVAVREHARAQLGGVAATLVWPAPRPARSTMSTRCTVAAGAHFDWHPEPTVSVRGSDHLIVTELDLAADATCRVIEELALGRHGEPSGALELRLRVDRGGRPLVRHTECFGPDTAGAGSAVGVGAARHVCSAVIVGVHAGQPRTRVETDVQAAWLPLADDAVVVLATGGDRPRVLAALRELAPELSL